MDYKMLVLDVDDTLVNSDHLISDKTKEALLKFQADGNILVLASGRPNQGMMTEAAQLQLAAYSSYIISFNGAVIIRLADEELVFQQNLSLEDQKELIPYLQENNLTVLTYDNGTIVMDKPNEYSEMESVLTGLPDKYDADYINNLDTPQIKFIAVGDPEAIKGMETELGGQFGKETTANMSKPYYLEFFHRDVSKGIAIEKLCEHYGISMDQVVAVGDSNNDASMIEKAGAGVAMGNGTDSLKALADYVTKSNDEDGIIDVIDRYFI